MSNSRILNNNSYHDITFRYLLQGEIKSALNGMVPISNEETRGQIMGTLFSYQRFNIVGQDSEIAVLTPSKDIKIFRTVLILYQGECVGTGSIWISSNNEQIAGNIG